VKQDDVADLAAPTQAPEPRWLDGIERDAWLSHMRDAVDSLELSPEQDATLWGYLEMAALSMQNRFPDETAGDLSPA